MARTSDTDADEPEISSLETHFVAREDDDETLWDVREIIAEKGKMYQVLWEGVDPSTGKPWPPDWVPKEDCTDPLVLAWKQKKAAKKAAGKRGRNSIQSRVSTTSRASSGSSATVTRPSVNGSTKVKSVAMGKKRKHDDGLLSTHSRASRSLSSEDESSAPPKKKQKVTPKSPSITARSSSSKVTSGLRNGRTVNQEPVREEEEESSQDELEIISRLKQSKRNPPLSKAPVINLASSSDEELPRPQPRPNNIGKKTTQNLLEAKAGRGAQKQPPQVPSAARKRVIATSDEMEVEDEIRMSNDRAPKKSRPIQSDFSDDNSPPKPPPRAKLKPVRNGRNLLPASSPPRVSPVSPKIVKRAGVNSKPSASRSTSSFISPPPPPHDAPPSPSASLLITGPEAQDITRSTQDARRDDDENSALEYVELPVSPRSGAPQISRKRSLSPQFRSQPSSPSPSPAPASPHSSHTSSSPATTSLHSSRKSKSPRIAHDSQFVSETEGEESQEPRQPVPPPLLRTPSKNSFTARMKPRTPGSRRNKPDQDLIASSLPFSDDGAHSPEPRPAKKLRPIPQVSPSKFMTLPPSTIESTDSFLTRDKHDDSIEQFESPDKSARVVGAGAAGTISQEIPDSTGGSSSGNGGSLPFPPAATNVMDKGVAMADAAAKKAKMNGVLTQARVALGTIIQNEKEKQRLRSVGRASDYESDDEGTEEEEEEEEEEESQRDGKVVQPTLEEFADSLVDWDAGNGQDIVMSQGQTQDHDEPTKTGTTENVVSGQQEVKVFERQEEEESTQDLLAEMQQQQQQQQLLLQQLERPVPGENEGWVHPVAPPPLASQVPQSGDEEMVDMSGSLEVVPPKSSAPIIDSFPDAASQLPLASQRTSEKRTSPPAELTPEIPPTLSPIRPRPEPLFASSSQSQDPQLEAAMDLLNRKSEEISRLESLLAAAQTTTQTLQVQNATLQSLSSVHENQISVLTDSVQSLESKISFAENNAEVFKRQYLEASAYASEVLAENRNLQEQIEVVESQVSSGVNGIRTMFEQRVQELEKEAAYHRQLATFVMEQTKRTGDEEIRKRAAEYPELEMRYKELESRLEGAGGMIDTMERLVTMKDKDIGDLRKEKREEKERMEKEMETLREEVEKLRRSGNVVNGEHPRASTPPTGTSGDMDVSPVAEGLEPKSTPPREDVRAATPVFPNGDTAASPEPEMESGPTTPREDAPGDIVVYRCLWRKDGSDRCDAMFATKEELGRHLETCGHIQ